VSSDITDQDTEEGARDGKKRCKQRLQGVTTTTAYDGGNNEEVGSSNMLHVVTTAGSDKC
jgi:hypothetical protein